MSKQKKSAELIFTVLLPNGKEIHHKYEVPSDVKKRKKLYDDVTDMVVKALTVGKPHGLLFDNPLTLYNPANVSGVRADLIGLVELQHVTEELSRKLGFVKD
jgi:hypothetical protein